MSIKLKQTAGLHNRFDFVLTDARTGEVKQTAQAENIITDHGLDRLLEAFFSSHYTREWSYHFHYYIHLGSGDTEPDPGNIALNEHLDEKITQDPDPLIREINEDEGWCQRTWMAHWTELELQNTEIREVGLASGRSGDLTTHALIKDEQGNPATISKGETDLLTVYATIYMELDLDSDYGDNFRMLNGFLDAIYDDARIAGSRSLNSLDVKLGSGSTQPSNHDTDLKSFKIAELSADGDDYLEKTTEETNSLIFWNRLPANEGNNGGIREFFAEWSRSDLHIFRAVLPIDGVWESYTIEDEKLGEGDGSNAEFNFEWVPIIDESETITVDGSTKTRDTDYVLHKGLGTDKDIFAYSGIETDEEEDWISGGGLEALTDGDTGTYCQINQNNEDGTFDDPAPWVVFNSHLTNYADKLRIYQGDTGRTIKDFKLEGSSDGVSWSEIANDTVPDSEGWYEFNFSEESYQYWKFSVQTSHGVDSDSVRIYQLELPSSKANIEFQSGAIPASGEEVKAEYDIDFIPKDENHVLDVAFMLKFSDIGDQF